MTVNDVFAEMQKGTFDAQLDVLEEMVRSRRKTLSVKLAASLAIGAKVRISGKVRPKYLAGIVGLFEGAASKPGFSKIRVVDPHVIARAGKYLDWEKRITVPNDVLESA